MIQKSILIIFASFCAVSSALRCWKCENQNENGCITNGEIEECQAGVQHTCQTEVRTDNGMPLIKTGCKQGIACSSNNEQNLGAAWSPTQCNSKGHNSVCRCCCTGSLCNKKKENLLCRTSRANPPITPPRTCGPGPEAPNNGEKQCFGDTGPRSFCLFKCNKGYILEGSDVSACRISGNEYLWDNPAPTCKEEICMTLPETPENGFKTCRGNGKIGSQCFFACKNAYKMYGPSSVKCEQTESGVKWTPKPPTCKIDTSVCYPLPPVPTNGDRECSGVGELGTKCDFTCNAGYYMIGHEHTACEKRLSVARGKWSNPTPTCKEVQCAFLPKTPRNAIKECTSDVDLGSVCSFSCNDGYQLKGYPSTTCRRDEREKGKGKWDREVPTCEPVCETLSEGPENGYINCDGKEVGDKCRYHCRPGFEIRGSETTACELRKQGAKWSDEAPVCEPVCKPLRNGPEYGEQTCLGDGNIGTSCMYACDAGFRLEGQSESVCKATEYGADWTAPVPTCIPVCRPEPSVKNGKTDCEGNGEVGSVCRFKCNKGRRLKGVSQVTCEFHSTRAKWSDEPPYCEHHCGALPEAIEHGEIQCDGAGELGTACNFTCTSEAYKLVGENVVSCLIRDGQARWSRNPCCIDCTNLKRDIMIGMDISGSISTEDWKNMVTFVQDFIRKFKYGEDATLFSVFQFGTKAQSPDELKGFRRYKDKEVMISKVGNMEQMKQLGQDTRTGIALQYALTRFNRASNRIDTPDMLFIITDGPPDEVDRVNMINAASKLRRKKKVEILVIAIAATDGFVKQMTDEVTKDEKKVIRALSIKQLTDVVDTLVSKACQDERQCEQH